jgi:hypothetical protein
MIGVVAVLTLVVSLAVDTRENAGAEMSPRPISRKAERLMPLGTIVSTHGDAVATARVILKRVEPPALSAQAEYMTVGPMGPWEADTVSTGAFSLVESSFRRLRVTLGSCERSQWLWIDDIVTARADSRLVKAQYWLGYFDPAVQDLHDALPRAPRVLGPDPGDPIKWISSTSFAWIMRADTLVVEQAADSVFQVTLRARVR